MDPKSDALEEQIFFQLWGFFGVHVSFLGDVILQMNHTFGPQL